MRSWTLLVLVVGCGSSPRPPPSHQVAGPTACLAKRFANGAIEQLDVQGDRVTLCYRAVEERDGSFSPSGEGPSDRVCFTLDARGAILGEVPYQESTERSEKAAPYTIEWTSGSSYKVCDAKHKCVAVAARHAPNEPSLVHAATVSDDGKRAFVMNARPGKAGHEIWGELLDVTGARSLSDFRLTEDNAFSDVSTTRAVDIYGDKVVIGIFHAGPCCGTWLFDGRDGKRIPLHDWDGHRFKVDATTLLAISGHSASVIDIPSLRELKSLRIPGAPFGDSPELRSSAIVQLPGGALVAHAQPAGIVLFDAKTRALTGAREIPLCEGPAPK